MNHFPEDGDGLDIEKLPRSRKEAEALGSKYFFAGNLCARGHLAPRYTKGRRCVECARSVKKRPVPPKPLGRHSRDRKLRQEAASRHQSTYVPDKPCLHGHRLRFTASRACVECDRLRREQKIELRKDAQVRRAYGLTAEQHEALFVSQRKSCPVCDTEAADRHELHVHSCHETGAIRGLLCQRCKHAVVLFEDDPRIIRKAADYVAADPPPIPGKPTG